MSTTPVDPLADPTTAPSLYDLLWQTTAYTHLMAEADLADTPLTVASSSIVAILARRPGTTVAEMARDLPKTQQALSQVVDRLVKGGLVERRLGAGRGVALHLSKSGEQAAGLAQRHQVALEERLRAALGAERSESLIRLLTEAREILSTQD